MCWRQLFAPADEYYGMVNMCFIVNAFYTVLRLTRFTL